MAAQVHVTVFAQREHWEGSRYVLRHFAFCFRVEYQKALRNVFLRPIKDLLLRVKGQGRPAVVLVIAFGPRKRFPLSAHDCNCLKVEHCRPRLFPQGQPYGVPGLDSNLLRRGPGPTEIHKIFGEARRDAQRRTNPMAAGREQQCSRYLHAHPRVNAVVNP